MEIELDKKQELLYLLIFSEIKEHEIQLMDYTDLYSLETFINEILEILIDTGIKISENVLILTTEKCVWKLKIR